MKEKSEKTEKNNRQVQTQKNNPKRPGRILQNLFVGRFKRRASCQSFKKAVVCCKKDHNRETRHEASQMLRLSPVLINVESQSHLWSHALEVLAVAVTKHGRDMAARTARGRVVWLEVRESGRILRSKRHQRARRNEERITRRRAILQRTVEDANEKAGPRYEGQVKRTQVQDDAMTKANAIHCLSRLTLFPPPPAERLVQGSQEVKNKKQRNFVILSGAGRKNQKKIQSTATDATTRKLTSQRVISATTSDPGSKASKKREP